ncbi:MAG: putative zinc-finger [Gemmatimonadetes bacterium]|nr:putative zinc-finger [Gemmatimonadota bacterium]
MSAPSRPQLEGLGLSSTCVDVLRHLWDYLDEEMTPTSAERLRAHIASCSTCQQYEGYQSCFLEAVAKLKAKLSAPEQLRAKLAEKLKGEGCGCWHRAKKD